MDVRRHYGNSARAYNSGLELSRYADVFQLGHHCENIGYGRSRSIGSYSLTRCISALNDAVREFEPDVIYAQENRPNLCAYVVSRLSRAARRAQVVFDFHASPAFEYRERGQYFHSMAARFIESMVLKRGRRITLASEYLRCLLKDNYGVDDSERIRVVPNGVPAQMIETRKSERSPFNFPEGTKVALAIIPRNFESNVLAAEFTVQVAKRLEANPRLRFVIIGGGPVLPAPPNVLFTGYVEDVLPYIDWADICLSPYPPVAHCGGARTKLVEFFARRKPVFSTREGIRGIDEAKDGEHVILGGDTPQEFADSLAGLLDGGRDLSLVGETAFSLVDEKYNWRTSGQSLLKFLERG